jgi:beta-galactosidase
VLTQAQAEHLAAYVRAGGHLVLGPRTGMKDDANALWPQRQPGPLAPLLGARVSQYYALADPVATTGALGDAQATIWAETLEPLAADVAVVQRYGKSNGWLDGQPAVVTRRVGAGTITYVGAWFDAPALARLAARLLSDAKVAPILPDAPAGIEVDERSGNGRRALVLINHNAEPVTLPLPAGAQPIVGDYAAGGLPAHGVAVVQLGSSKR